MRDFLEEFFLGYILPVLVFLFELVLIFMALGGLVVGIMVIVTSTIHGVPIFIFLGLFLIVVGILAAAGVKYIAEN